jgi:hypothetical protein
MNLFGFGKKDEDELSHEEMLSKLVSSSKHNEIQQKAYQAIQRDLEAQPGFAHPYEAEIQVDCLKTDSKITDFHTKKLKDCLSDAQYLSVLLDAGLKTELHKSTPVSLEHDLKSVIGQYQGDANRIKSELSEAIQALKIFKGANGIQRPADYPHSQSNTMFLIAAFAIGEAIANSIFLKWQNSGLMSLALALGIALINVVGNVMLGIRYRDKNHIANKTAITGQRNFIYSVLLILTLNTAIALYRAYVIDFEIDGKFLFESLILFAIGILLGILSFREGYKMDDEYPGYGPLDRKVKEIEKQLEEIRVQYSGYANNLIEAGMSNLDRIDQRILTTSASFQAKLPEMAAEIENWNHNRSSLLSAYEELIHVFRVVYIANVPTNANKYPKTLTPLPSNSQLEIAKKQITQFLKRRDKLDKDITVLRNQVLEAKKILSDWLKSNEGQKLIDWPT